MRQDDEALGLGLDEDLVTAMEFIKDISDSGSFVALDEADRVDEFRVLLFRIDRRNSLLGRAFKLRKVNERLRRDEHLTLMHQQN